MDMKKDFLKKHHQYCKTQYSGNDIFKTIQQEEEILEDFVELFSYNLQK